MQSSKLVCTTSYCHDAHPGVRIGTACQLASREKSNLVMHGSDAWYDVRIHRYNDITRMVRFGNVSLETRHPWDKQCSQPTNDYVRHHIHMHSFPGVK